MYHNYVFADVNEALPELLAAVNDERCEVGSRAGKTRELTHVGITLTHPWRREVLLPGRNPSIAAQIAETMWVLSGRHDMEFLSQYLPRAKQFSDDGLTWRAGYGARLRKWRREFAPAGEPFHVDQLAYVLKTLSESPNSRQAVMSIWDPAIDTKPGKDIPCNDWLNFIYRNGKLDLHVAIRSNDAMWGWSGINSFEWSALLEVTAGILGFEVGSLHFSVTSFHLYERHWDKAKKILELSHLNRFSFPPKDSPQFDRTFCSDLDRFDELCKNWFGIAEAIRMGYDMDARVDDFPEPMLQSWLRVIQWWWTANRDYLVPLKDTKLEMATRMSIQPQRDPEPVTVNFGVAPTSEKYGIVAGVYAEENITPFMLHALKTHDEKHAAYGDSWKRRGEMLGIMANIARKIDRLGGVETSDETSADTAMDLMVYLAKYRVWLDEQTDGPIFLNWGGTDNTIATNELLVSVEVELDFTSWPKWSSAQSVRQLEESLGANFEHLEREVRDNVTGRKHRVESMLRDAYRLARHLYKEVDEYRGADHE